MKPIYLDHAATTPLDPRVLEAMMPHLKAEYGNASSVHALGRKARYAVEEARERIAGYLGAEPSEILFTSGGTEADNLAVLGIRPPGRPGLLISKAEHEAILKPAERLAKEGMPVTILDPEPDGAVSVVGLSAALDSGTGLVSLMWVNNEVGTFTDVEGVVACANAAGALVHCDAVQAAGTLPLEVDRLGVDALTLSGHKLYGPKGVGVLYVRSGTPLAPLIQGGAQERGRRAGTENVAAIVGMAEAVRLLAEERPARVAHLASLQRRLKEGLREALGDRYRQNTPDEGAAPHILNIAFPPRNGERVDGEMLLLNLDLAGICVSAGSACTSGTLNPSHVLLAMGLPPETASAALRFSIGKDNSEADIDRAVEVLAAVLERMERTPA